MKIRDIHPEFINLSEEDFISQIPYPPIFNLFMDISDYYDKELPLWQVLRNYGIYDVDEYSDQIQINCLNLEHGSTDFHKSARYFSINRETGEYRPSVYCYKCNKLLTSFWYLYKYEKDHHSLNIKEIYLMIWKKFGVKFPRDLVLEFDPDTFFSFDNDFEEKKSLKDGFIYAEKVRELKDHDLNLYFQYLKSILQGNYGQEEISTIRI